MNEIKLRDPEDYVLIAPVFTPAKTITVEDFQRQFMSAKTKSAQLAACLRVLANHGYCSKIKAVPDFWDKRKEYLGQ